MVTAQSFDSKNRLDAPGGEARVPVVLDGRMLIEEGTGVASYSRALRQALRQSGVRYAILADRRTLAGHATTRLERWRRHVRAGLRYPRRVRPAGPVELPSLAGEAVIMGADVFREAQVFFDRQGQAMPLHLPGPPGIMHWTYPVPVFAVGWRNIYTVHDMIPIDHPELTPIDHRRFARLFAEVTRRAAAVLTVSDAAAESIRRAAGGTAPLVMNCGLSIDLPPPDDAPPPLVPGSYYFCAGTIEPRKNLDRLAEAHSRSGTARPLLIAGPTGWQGEAIRARLEQMPNVRLLSWLPRTDLMRALRGARALLFPSLAEGFGLPVAEAFALGTPVLTSDRGALSEVGGDAALKADPEDGDALAAAIGLLDRDDGLCAALAAAGSARAAEFSLECFVERLRHVYAGVTGKIS